MIMRQRKGRLGAMTLQAKCREPMSDWRSRRRQQVLVCQAETSEHSLLNLSSGSLASMVEEFRSIPTNSNCEEGRNVFPRARGMFRLVIRVRSLHRAVVQWERGGTRAMEKSSKMCRVPLMLSL